MFDAETVGRKISVLRKKRSITQMELANRLGLSFQAVSNWERGVAMPDIGNLKLLAQLLGTTVDDILGDERAAKIISDVEEGKTPSDPVKPAEFIAVAPLLEPEQNDALLDAVREPFSADEAREAAPNLAFGGEFDKSDAELAELFFERGNIAMFSIVEGGLTKERRRELLMRAISNGDMAFIALLSDAMGPEDGAAFAENAFSSGNVGMFSMFEDKLPRERRAELALKSYESGNIAFFAILSDCLTHEQKRVIYNRAAADGNVAIFSILHGYASDTGEKSAAESKAAPSAKGKKQALLEEFTRLTNKYAELGEEYNRMRTGGANPDELSNLGDRMSDLGDELNDIKDELADVEEIEKEEEQERRARGEAVASAGVKLDGLKGLLERIGGMFK